MKRFLRVICYQLSEFTSCGATDIWYQLGLKVAPKVFWTNVGTLSPSGPIIYDSKADRQREPRRSIFPHTGIGLKSLREICS